MRVAKRKLAGVTSQTNRPFQKGDVVEEKPEQVKSFANLLGAEVEANREVKPAESKNEKIFSLVASLDHLGEQLKKQPTLEFFIKYRNHIKKILELGVPQSVGLKKTFTRPSVQNPRYREFQLLNVIDSELDSLLKMVKDKEKNRLSLANKVLSIKGLIIDLLS